MYRGRRRESTVPFRAGFSLTDAFDVNQVKVTVHRVSLSLWADWLARIKSVTFNDATTRQFDGWLS